MHTMHCTGLYNFCASLCQDARAGRPLPTKDVGKVTSIQLDIPNRRASRVISGQLEKGNIRAGHLGTIIVEFPSGPMETDYPNLVLEAPIKLISKIRRKNPKKKPAGASTKKPARCVGSRGSVAAPIASSKEDDEDECGDEEDEEEDEEDDDGDQNDETSRGLFQRAIAAVGAHYALGQRPWRMYRAFERQLWSRAKRRKLPQNEVFLCAGRVFKTYRDQLTVPLKGNERALESMRRFVAASDIE